MLALWFDFWPANFGPWPGATVTPSSELSLKFVDEDEDRFGINGDKILIWSEAIA